VCWALSGRVSAFVIELFVFEDLHGQEIPHLSGQPVPLPHHPDCKNLFAYIQSKSPLSYFETIPPRPIKYPEGFKTEPTQYALGILVQTRRRSGTEEQ